MRSHRDRKGGVGAPTQGRAARGSHSLRVPASTRTRVGRQPACHRRGTAQGTRQDFPCPTRGRASLVLLLVGAIAVLIAAVWITLRTEPPPAPTGARVVQAPTAPRAPATELAPPIESAAETRASEPAEPAEPQAAAAPPPAQRLRMEIVDERGAQVTGEFQFEIRRVVDQDGQLSRSQAIQRKARGPRVDLDLVPELDWSKGEAGKQLTDPAAEVIVRGAGQYAKSMVPVARTADVEWTRIVVQATSLVRGSILDGAGNPLEGIAVMLRDNAPGSAPHSATATDAAGSFAIDALPGVRNRLFVGDERYPWVPVVELESAPGPHRLDPIRVELHAATIRVQRKDGSPAAGAQLEGIGLDGGRFTATTDADGRARVTTLLRGRWRVNATDASAGRASRAIEIPLAQDEPVLLILAR